MPLQKDPQNYCFDLYEGKVWNLPCRGMCQTTMLSSVQTWCLAGSLRVASRRVQTVRHGEVHDVKLRSEQFLEVLS